MLVSTVYFHADVAACCNRIGRMAEDIRSEKLLDRLSGGLVVVDINSD